MKDRQNYIDVAKAFGIIVMTMGHVSFGWEFNQWIAGFHMPLFFFISGYLFYEKNLDVKNYLIKKSRSLLVPYITIGLINFTIWYALNRDIQALNMLKHLLFINTDGMEISGPLWFLTAMFISSIILFIVNKYIKIRILKSIIIVLLMSFGMLETQILPCRLPYAMGCGLVGSGFMYIGLIYKIYSDKLKMHRSITYIALFVIASVLIMLNGHVNMREGMYAILPVSVINASIMSVAILELSKNICDKLNKSIIGTKNIKIVSAIGRYSLVYLGFNQGVIFVLTPAVYRIESILLKQLILFLMSFALLSGIAYVIYHTKIKSILGVRK